MTFVGVEIDRLDIEVEMAAEKANKQIDLMIKKLEKLYDNLSAIGMKNENFKKLGDAITQQSGSSKFKDLTKSAEDLQKRLKNVGKDLNFSGNLFEVNKEIESVEKRLDSLLLREEKFNTLGRDQNLSVYKSMQYDIAEACNYLDTLYDKQKQLKAEQPKININGVPYDQWDASMKDTKNTILDLGERLGDFGKSFNNSDINAQTQKLKQTLTGIGTEAENSNFKINKLGVDSSFYKFADKLREFSALDMFSKMSAWIKDFQTKIGVRVPTEEYTKLAEKIKQAETAYQGLLDKQDRMEAQGINHNSANWKGLQYDIKVSADRVAELNRDMELLKVHGGDTERISYGFKNIAIGAASSDSAIGRVANKLKLFVEKIQNTASGLVFSKGAMDKFNISSLSLAKSLTKVTNILKMMVIRLSLRGVINNVGEAFKHLAKESFGFNSRISDLMASCKQLAHSIAALSAPLVNLFGPALSYIIGLLNTSVSAVNQFLSAFAGNGTYNKAIKQNFDYAASLDKAAGSTKKLSTMTLGIDELNILSNNYDNSESGSGVDGGTGKYYETSEIDSGIKSLADRIKAILKTDNWSEIGQMIAEKLNLVLTSIPWEKVQMQAERIAKGIGTLINGFAETFDWSLLGYTIGQGINTALIFCDNLISTFDFGLIGRSITGAIGGFFNALDWSNIGSTLSHSIAGLLDFFRGLIEGTDWSSIPMYIVTAIGDFFTGFDWNGVAQSLGSLLAAAVNSAIELAGSIWDMLKQAWGNLNDYFNTYIEDAGGDIIDGLWNGITDALINCGKWIKDNLFTPFIDGFKEAFGIHSPSTVMSEQGGFIIDGLWLGISERMSLCGEKIKGVADSILGFFEELPSKFIEIGKNIISGLWNGIQDTWSNVKTGISDFCTNFLNGFKEGWDINSPSRKMKEIAEYAILGLIDPFTDSGSTMQQIYEFANSVLDIFQEQLSPKRFSVIAENAILELLNIFNLGFQKIQLVSAEIMKLLSLSLVNTLTQMSHNIEVILTAITETVSQKWDMTLLQTKNSWIQINTLTSQNLALLNNGLTSGMSVVNVNWVEKWNQFVETVRTSCTEVMSAVQALNDSVMSMCSSMKAAIREVQATAASMGSISVNASVICSVRGFASGGYPETGQLFLARENGLNEMVGHIGNRPAVANNDQIVESVKFGVRQGVADAVSEILAPYLSDIARNTRETADKDFHVNIGDREISRANDRGRAERGYVLIT